MTYPDLFVDSVIKSIALSLPDDAISALNVALQLNAVANGDGRCEHLKLSVK